MSDKVEFDLEDLDDLKDLIGDERKRADFSSQKVFSLLVLNWQYFLFSPESFFPFGAQLAVLPLLIYYLREWSHSVSAIH